MRFVFTLNLPSFKNNLVQEVIGEYQATSLREIYGHLQKGQRWLLVDQLYITSNGDSGKGLESHGEILLNADVIGKIKLFVENKRGQ